MTAVPVTRAGAGASDLKERGAWDGAKAELVWVFLSDNPSLKEAIFLISFLPRLGILRLVASQFERTADHLPCPLHITHHPASNGLH